MSIRCPIVAITAQVARPVIGNDAFQEADVTGITMPISKHNTLVMEARQIPLAIHTAFYLARTGRPGPVLVDLPKDVVVARTEFVYPEAVKLRGYNPTYEGHIGQIKKALKTLHEARRPVIYAGGGVILSNAARELTELARQLEVPVTATFGLLAVFVCFAIAYDLGKRLKQEAIISATMAGLGSAGLFTAILVALITVRVQKFFTDRNVVIRLPASVPAVVCSLNRCLIRITSFLPHLVLNACLAYRFNATRFMIVH